MGVTLIVLVMYFISPFTGSFFVWKLITFNNYRIIINVNKRSLGIGMFTIVAILIKKTDP